MKRDDPKLQRQHHGTPREQLDACLEYQENCRAKKKKVPRIGEILAHKDFLSKKQLAALLSALGGGMIRDMLLDKGTAAAFGYSVVATFAPRLLPPGTVNVYYEAAAVIVALILLGRFLEARAKGRTSEAIKRLFEHFFTTKDGGMGIGLTICQSIVQAHGGKIAVCNMPEGGAQFSFVLSAIRPEGDI